MKVQTKLVTKRFGRKVALITEENSTTDLVTSPAFHRIEMEKELQ